MVLRGAMLIRVNGIADMFLLAGLMGMMALGATAFLGMSPDDEDEVTAQDVPEDDMPDVEVADAESSEAGTSIMDFINSDADTGAPASGMAGSATPSLSVTDQVAADSLLPTAGTSSDIVMDAETDADVGPVPNDESETAERVVVGTSGEDQMDGSDAVDVANGYDGDDSISGAEGDDELWGALGDDTLTGDAGNDTLHGGAGNDVMQGGDGDDRMFGHGDDDILDGGAGDDSLVGGDGDDVLDGGEGDDSLHGGLGDDALRGGAGHDVLFGGWGNDTLSGFEDDQDAEGWNDTDVMDYLNGGGGDDLITAGAGDIVTGGAGADTILLGEWLSADHQAEILDFAPDEDTLMVIFDDLADAEPDVDLVPDPDNAGIQHVMLNGVPIAAVNNTPGLNAGHITLIGSSQLPAGAML